MAEDGLKKALDKLMSFTLDDVPESFKKNEWYEAGDENQPFFSEAFLYPLLGKEDARTVLTYIKSLVREVQQFDPDYELVEVLERATEGRSVDKTHGAPWWRILLMKRKMRTSSSSLSNAEKRSIMEEMRYRLSYLEKKGGDKNLAKDLGAMLDKLYADVRNEE